MCFMNDHKSRGMDKILQVQHSLTGLSSALMVDIVLRAELLSWSQLPQQGGAHQTTSSSAWPFFSSKLRSLGE